jgi:hypothetical protein
MKNYNTTGTVNAISPGHRAPFRFACCSEYAAGFIGIGMDASLFPDTRIIEALAVEIGRDRAVWQSATGEDSSRA